MSHTLSIFLLAVGLFAGMLVMLEIGRCVGVRRLKAEGAVSVEGFGAVDGAVFAMLGLLIAFTFSGASTRFDARRQLIVEETNNIGTAYLRLDLLPHAAQEPLREKFREYLDTRIVIYEKFPDVILAKDDLLKSAQLQTQIWRDSVAASRAEGASLDAPILLLPALNAMFDITTTQMMATRMHPPVIVFIMLFGLALAASLLAGYGMVGSKVLSRFHMVGFALVMAVSVYVIMDVEYPRLGLIQVDAFDQALIDLRQSMTRQLPAPGQR
ncbi:MAG TPA: DUF4239 domain-containing protein [Candidatus Binatia bacterium]